MVRVRIANRMYEMSIPRLNGLLKIASGGVKKGIYALRYRDYYELRRDEMTTTQLKKAKRDYKSKGITVYANE